MWRNVLIINVSLWRLAAELPIKWIPVIFVFIINMPEREANHSSPPRSDSGNVWIITSTLQYVFLDSCTSNGTTLVLQSVRNITIRIILISLWFFTSMWLINGIRNVPVCMIKEYFLGVFSHDRIITFCIFYIIIFPSRRTLLHIFNLT